nr:cytochrome P450 CYP316 [Ectropis obliqua]
MISTFAALVLVIILGYIINNIIKPKNYPPGPKWYPFAGSSSILHSYTKKYGSQYKALLELSKEYSTQVLGLKLGSEKLVVVYGEKNVRQVFTEKAFEGRPDSFFLRLRSLGKRMGITFTDGELWRIHRQFTVTQLRNVGFGKSVMEKEIQNELIHVLDYLKKNNKQTSPSKFVSQAVMNVLWIYVAGEKIKEDKWKYMQELFMKRSRAFSMAGGLLNQFPWCRFFIPQRSGYSLIKKLNDQISEIIEEAIQKHKRKEIVGQDFIYSFLDEISQNKETFTEEQLKTVCLDLLIAGSQTTSNSLEFALLQLLRNRSIQNKIHDEIDQVLGDDMPCWADNARLVYTSAFILELQRYNTIAPLAGPRRVLQDAVVDGYLVPKDTTVLISLADIHEDSSLWSDPQVFNPDRFIDERGMLKNLQHMYFFGLGRRRCPGESLAKSFVFLTLVGILQKYRIECSNGVLPSAEPIVGLIASPRPFVADFVLRKPT